MDGKSIRIREKITVTVNNRENMSAIQNLRGKNSKGRWVRIAILVICGLALFARLSWILFHRHGQVHMDSIILDQADLPFPLQATVPTSSNATNTGVR